jgi:hypothetical protein
VDLRSYYGDPHVRRRMREFLGGPSDGEATSAYLCRCDSADGDGHRRGPERLDEFLEAGWEVGRSLWDHEGLIAHLDIEYVNYDYPGEAIEDPQRAFRIQQPLVDAIEEVLADYGVSSLHLLTGRGHHFVWRVPYGTPAASSLVAMGRMPRHMALTNATIRSPRGDRLPVEACRGHAGLGLVMERLSHRFVEKAAPECEIPVELTDVRVGPGERGREGLSIDLSEYGDPVHTRMIRLPFSAYLKPWLKPGLFSPDRHAELPLLFAVPQHEFDTRAAIDVMRDPERARDLARRASARIPDGSDGTRRLIEDYRASPLARFHDWYYDHQPEAPERWPETYDVIDLERLPPCVAESVRRPNDVLLQPAGIRRLVATLWADGWHPRDVAGLIRSKYERDHGWGGRWFHYDAATRADFYTRLFASWIAVGNDELVDYNCQSEKEKGLCARPFGDCDLTDWRRRALERRWT